MKKSITKDELALATGILGWKWVAMDRTGTWYTYTKKPRATTWGSWAPGGFCTIPKTFKPIVCDLPCNKTLTKCEVSK